MAATGSPQVTDRTFRFGPFELSEREGDLRKNGIRIKLQEQPFRVLVELVANAGKVVPREELQNRLWPEDTFVDFDTGLNTAIRKLRQALNDDADNPHYIETVAKRGYRFIAEVTLQRDSASPRLLTEERSPFIAPSPNDVAAHAGSRSATAVEEAVPADATAVEALPEEPSRRGQRNAILAIVLLILAIMGSLVYYFAIRPYPIPTVKNYKQLTFDGGQKYVLGVDGSRIFLLLVTPEYFGMAELSTSGGELRKVPLLPTHESAPLQVSADGTQLLVIDPGPPNALAPPSHFYSIPILGGAPRRLGEIKGLHGSWSNDRSLLAYSTFDTIYLANGDGTGSRKLTTIPDLQLSWGIVDTRLSPDGRIIRFAMQSSPGKPLRLWEINSDGTGLHQLLPGFSSPAEDELGGWSTDNRYYFFDANQQLWVLPERRSFLSPKPKPIPLTSGPMGFGTVAFSSDHRNLYVFGAHFGGELVRYDLQSGLYAPFLGGISAEYLSFSPDRQWVAYVTYPEGILWRSKADGSERLQLTVPPGYVISPRWSPDSRTIYYTAVFEPEAKLFEVSVEGGEPKLILSEEGITLLAPSPSPDGRKLVFARCQGPCIEKSNDTIQILDLDTGHVSMLPGSKDMAGPHWSPDGRYIASQSWDAKKLFFYDLKTQHWTEVDSGNEHTWLEFSHDGHFLYYLAGSSICRLRVSDRHIDRFPIKNLPGTGHWGLSLSLGPDDMPLLLHDKTAYDIYALELEWK